MTKQKQDVSKEFALPIGLDYEQACDFVAKSCLEDIAHGHETLPNKQLLAIINDDMTEANRLREMESRRKRLGLHVIRA